MGSAAENGSEGTSASDNCSASQRKAFVWTALIIGFPLLWYLWPVLTQWIYFPQDRCSFGTVSNAQYRDYLSEATRLRTAKWPPLKYNLVRGPERVSERDLSQRLLTRLQSFTENSKSPDEIVARIHALMRAHGARYRTTRVAAGRSRNKDFVKKYGDVNFIYFGSSIAFGMYYPLSIYIVFFIRINTNSNIIVRSTFSERNYLDRNPYIEGQGMFSCPEGYSK